MHASATAEAHRWIREPGGNIYVWLEPLGRLWPFRKPRVRGFPRGVDLGRGPSLRWDREDAIWDTEGGFGGGNGGGGNGG